MDDIAESLERIAASWEAIERRGVGKEVDKIVNGTEARLTGEENEGRRIGILFGFRRRLVSLLGSECHRDVIFEARERIAGLFEQYGGQRHQENVALFRGLSNASDLQAHAEQPKTVVARREQVERVEKDLPGFYVVSRDPLDIDQLKSIRLDNPANRNGRKGKQIHLSKPEQLFRIPDDGRPIFVHMDLTPRCREYLQLFVDTRPEFCDLIYHVSWATGSLRWERLSFATADGSGGRSTFAEQVFNYLHHEPQVGDVFLGKVEAVDLPSIQVRILPGISGFARVYDDDAVFNVGDEVRVRVTVVKGDQANRSDFHAGSTGFLAFVQDNSKPQHMNRTRSPYDIDLEIETNQDAPLSFERGMLKLQFFDSAE